MSLPISRVVNVSITRNRFAARTGFGVPILLTTQAKAGKLDASNLTRAYGSPEEVAADWDAADAFYKAAIHAFAQNPRPIQVKAGFLGATVADADALSDAMDAIEAVDDGWYWVDVEAGLRDDAKLQGLIDWAESRRKLVVVTSNDLLMEDPSDTTNIAASNKGEVERTAVFYSRDADKYPGFAFAAVAGTFDFNQPDSAYTGKFKRLASMSTLDRPSADVQAATGFTPNVAQAVATGHMANVYVDIGGLPFVVEGSTLTPNRFVDQIHAGDWLASEMEQEILNILANNARVPMDARGMETLAAGARAVMARANQAGLVANDFDDDGELLPAFAVIAPDVFSISESQRAARIAPPVKVEFRAAGAVHYVNVNVDIRD